MIYRICVTKFGYAEVEADSEDEALGLVDDMWDKDFDWSDFDDVTIIDEFEA